jgi:glycosyltransferase involved in cell wall biosynthesis
VATLTPRKGHAVLFDALAELCDRSWHLYCVGSLERDAGTAAALRTQIERLGLAGRVTLLGEVTAGELAERYATADLFVLASYLEGYGMALTDALACGLPVISTTAGAIPDTVTADSAILVPPGNSGELAAALATVMDEPGTRKALGTGAQTARNALPTWEEASADFGAQLRALL